MNRSVLWILLVTAPLVSAGSLDSFQATCSAAPGSNGVCGGGFSDFSFTFGGPFIPGFPGPNQFAPGEPPSFIEFEVGSSGGTFTYQGNTCNYDMVIHGSPCDGSVVLGSSVLATPDDRGLSPGDVVSVVGPGRAEGFFCASCNGAPSSTPIFDIEVRASYQFTLTAPGTPTPFSWTGAQFSSVPEPASWVFATLGLAGVAAGLLGRRLQTLPLR
ncbi:MAG TPA: PEP-CTERM sorting domain-containing protein [Bryobacteraceae bacterium]|jgi:hypothetical protein|nr:PEP-CTERM sorting domain-containing protein [Bryobacteraceae bacterium]